ncbi:MAG TPA: arginine--tRNA ligase [Chthoniobacterales bacterium]
MQTPQALLAEKLSEAVLPKFPEATIQIGPATDSRFGDYQSNVAMTVAKAARRNPREVAAEIISRLDLADISEKPEIAGPGFINFRLKTDWLARQFSQLAGDDRLGIPPLKEPKKYVVDFSSPNVAKPMHIGHLRSTILGDTLARIAEFLGHSVIRDNHIGDWGTQFGMLLTGWKTELNPDALTADPTAEMERLYKLISARCKDDPSTLDRVRQELVLLQSGDTENLDLWKEMIRLSERQFETVYGRLGIRFDVVLGESFYNPWLKEVVDSLKKAGIVRESEGAWCVFSDGSVKPEEDPFLIKDKDGWRDNPALVQKSDGGFNYTTTDIATLDYRLKTWAPDEIIVTTDGRQQMHFRQLFAIFRRWQPEAAAKVRLSHVWFGTILGSDGKPFKTRSGETVKLANLLDEAEERAFALVSEKNPELPEDERREVARIVGLGAVKYADLLPNRQSDYVFSWDKMLSFQGNTAPYLQYSHVRIQSIFRKGGSPKVSAENIVLSEAAEIGLAKKLLQFGEVLPTVLDDHRPNILANYLYELASTFHSFFETCPVLKSEGATRETRLALCATTARILERGLELLGIEVPERM